MRIIALRRSRRLGGRTVANRFRDEKGGSYLKDVRLDGSERVVYPFLPHSFS